MEQGSDELHLHPLAERQLADRLVEQPADIEQIDEFIHGLAELFRLDAIDLLVQAKRLSGGQIPPQLILLSHDEGEATPIGVIALPRHEAQNACFAGGGIDYTREEFERRGFSGTIGTEKGDELAHFDFEIDAANGLHLFVFAMK